MLGLDVGEGAFGRLAVVDVDQPLGEEGGHVGVHRRRADEDLGVAHPAQTLVALRTIGGNADVVSALAPDDVRLELVDAGIGAGEFAGTGHIGAEHDARHGVAGTPVTPASPRRSARSLPGREPVSST